MNLANSESSQIGNLNTSCLSDFAWDSLCNIYSINNIKDSVFSMQINKIKNHYISPNYILYFDKEPKEIIGCDDLGPRVVFNPKLAHFALDGLSPELSDEEQVRMRNRVQILLMKYQCKSGQNEAIQSMQKPAPFSMK